MQTQNRARFDHLRKMLPPDIRVVGIDGHTALILNPARESCRVMGRGAVTLLSRGREDVFTPGQTLAITELGPFSNTEPQCGIPAGV